MSLREDAIRSTTIGLEWRRRLGVHGLHDKAHLFRGGRELSVCRTTGPGGQGTVQCEAVPVTDLTEHGLPYGGICTLCLTCWNDVQRMNRKVEGFRVVEDTSSFGRPVRV